MSQTVIGIFNSSSEAQNAVHQLLSNGFTESNIDVASANSGNYSNQSTNRDNDYDTAVTRNHDNDDDNAVTRFFKNLFGNDDDESERYSRAAQRGCVVTVHAQSSDEAERASMLLDQYGAIDVDENERQYRGDYDQRNTGYVDERTGLSAERTGLSDERTSLSEERTTGYDKTNFDKDYDNVSEGKTLSVIEENLQVGKKEVETGGVRLRSRIVERPVEESLRLREEHIRVERNKVDRAASATDLDNFEEGTIEVTQRSEVPVVSKEARVVEEVSLGKEVEHREETVRDTVRKTEIDVEEFDKDRTRKDL
jgi:uncharacterized protein (TIGR02271 family)